MLQINHHCGNTFGLRSWTATDECSIFQVVEVWFCCLFPRCGITQLLQIITVAVFTIEYAFRFWASAEDPDANFSRLVHGTGCKRCMLNTLLCCVQRYSYSFFSIVDLIAIVPFYIDLCIPQVQCHPPAPAVPHSNLLSGFAFVSVPAFAAYVPDAQGAVITLKQRAQMCFRQVEGRFRDAFDTFDEVLVSKKVSAHLRST